MNPALPEVSVVMPVLDGEAWVERSVRSALEQTLRSIEVLVVDDGSTDRTPEILARLGAQDARLKVLHGGRRRGPGGARNLAFDAARGRWIAFLDADDRFHPERLERLLAAAREHGATLLADNPHALTEQGRDDGVLWPWVTAPTRVDATEWARRNAWDGRDAFGYGYAKPLVLRELIESPRLRMREELRMMEDYHFVLALLRRGHELLLLPDGLYDYTVRREGAATRATPEKHLAAVLSAGREVMEEVPPGPLRTALERQQHTVELRAVRFEVLQRLKAHDAFGAARLLVREPGALPFVATSLREVLQRRLHASR
jgi:succinoglycan biosynthesis protein ExoO